MTHRPKLIEQNISLDKATYEIIRNSILKNLMVYGAMPSDQLASLVKNHLNSKSEGTLWRYYSLVKQELEIRGEIRCVPNTKPPRIEIAT